MTSLPHVVESVPQVDRAVPLICPDCHGPLQWAAEEIHCLSCHRTYGYENGFPNLVLGDRFGDEPNPELVAYEEECNIYTARNYFLPLFQDLFRGAKRKPRILSLGCGTGADVDLLTDAGFSVMGIDCGARSCAWPHRTEKHQLLLANGQQLPFESESFDAVYCGCVFPHVGTVGDSHQVAPGFAEKRAQLAAEMSRVLRPGGHIVTSSPNRRFPLDIFHGRTESNPLPRYNASSDPFLLSFTDYQNLFRPANCERFRLLPVEGYWGFVRRKNRLLGRLSAAPVEAIFRLVSHPSGSRLRDTAINPWLVVLGAKALR